MPNVKDIELGPLSTKKKKKKKLGPKSSFMMPVIMTPIIYWQAEWRIMTVEEVELN